MLLPSWLSNLILSYYHNSESLSSDLQLLYLCPLNFSELQCCLSCINNVKTQWNITQACLKLLLQDHEDAGGHKDPHTHTHTNNHSPSVYRCPHVTLLFFFFFVLFSISEPCLRKRCLASCYFAAPLVLLLLLCCDPCIKTEAEQGWKPVSIPLQNSPAANPDVTCKKKKKKIIRIIAYKRPRYKHIWTFPTENPGIAKPSLSFAKFHSIQSMFLARGKTAAAAAAAALTPCHSLNLFLLAKSKQRIVDN